MSRVFLDTNFFVYASDDGAPAKRDHAKQKWNGLLGSPDIPVISTQVLQEYFNILPRKLRLSPAEAKDKLLLLGGVEVVLLDPSLILAAIDLHVAATISFWDALIITAAQSAQCHEIWTEDLQDGRSFGTLRVVNPFAGV